VDSNTQFEDFDRAGCTANPQNFSCVKLGQIVKVDLGENGMGVILAKRDHGRVCVRDEVRRCFRPRRADCNTVSQEGLLFNTMETPTLLAKAIHKH
jgi:hypothetical protein